MEEYITRLKMPERVKNISCIMPISREKYAIGCSDGTLYVHWDQI